MNSSLSDARAQATVLTCAAGAAPIIRDGHFWRPHLTDRSRRPQVPVQKSDDGRVPPGSQARRNSLSLGISIAIHRRRSIVPIVVGAIELRSDHVAAVVAAASSSDRKSVV